MRETGSKYLSKVLRYPARAALVTQGPVLTLARPLPDPCRGSVPRRSPPTTTSWLEPGKHHGPTPTYRTAPLSTTPTAPRRVSLCACAVLSHPPVARGRPSQRLRQTGPPCLTLTLTLILDLALSNFPRAPAPLVRLSPFFSRSLARRLSPPSTYYLIIIYARQSWSPPSPIPRHTGRIGSGSQD